MGRVIFYCGNSQYDKVVSCFIEHIDYVCGVGGRSQEFDAAKNITPDELASKLDSDTTVVISPARTFAKTRKMLSSTYGVPKKCMTDSQTWVLEQLRAGVQFTPREVELDASTACQLNCPGCYMRREGPGAVGIGWLKYEDFKKFVDRNPFVSTIEFSNNGEPFLNPHMHDILRLCKERGITSMFTNGVNFNTVSDQVLHDLVECNVWYVNLSIDGTTQDVYEQYRRGGSLETVLENVRRVNEYRAQVPNSPLFLTWKFILMNHNQHQAAEAKRMAEELGMGIRYEVDWSGTFVPQDPEWLEEVTGRTFRYKKKLFKALRSEVIPRRNLKNANMYTFCDQMLRQPCINWDGQLLGCNKCWKEGWGINVFETGLVEAVNSERYRTRLIEFLTDRVKTDPGPCRHCNYFQQHEGKRLLANI